MEGFTTEATVRKISPKGHLDQGIMKYDVEAVFLWMYAAWENNNEANKNRYFR